MHDLFSLRPQKDLEQVFTYYADLLCTLLSSDSLQESYLLYVADFSMALKYLSTPIPERIHVSFKMTENISEQTAQTAERVLIRTLPLLTNIAQKHKEYAALNHIADALNIKKTFSELLLNNMITYYFFLSRANSLGAFFALSAHKVCIKSFFVIALDNK